MVFAVSAIRRNLDLQGKCCCIFQQYCASGMSCLLHIQCFKASGTLSGDDMLNSFIDTDLWLDAKMDEVNAYLRGCKGLNLPDNIKNHLRV